MWHRAVPGAIGSVTVFPESGRAAVRHNADARWGDCTAAIADDGSADASLKVYLDDPDGERHHYNADALAVCCYEGCTASATERDDDGDSCCERHRWQGERFVELHDLEDGTTFDAQLAARYVALMQERGWTVEIREPNRGEAGDQTYYRKDDGTLQILGFSVPVPEAYEQDARDCYDAACSGR